ncbi:ABC transporter permease [Arsenicicoccus sp. oral taxon 190]|uniref:ABC transporter permease n=1 Tax=Arsenicicoccus sp. oral taxon 190 TaxID=1658671 RepID=UPI00067A15C0|nr:ABC transporter permease [Arsenicicoccus sp. oral taxon 190]AKT50395.1 ABC transporter [Arsenicicoccus sp. oral taxon 190]
MTTIFRDADTIARRNLIKIKRVPDLIVFTTLQPIMFILLFGYVFGSLAGSGNGQGYREFLMAGIFAQTIIFGATITGSGMAEDMQKGVIDRFRTLPMHPGAVLLGRTLSDLLNNVIVLVVMTLTGLAIGWRIRDGLLHAALAYLVMLLFAYAMSWVMAYVGLKVRAPEIFNNATFMLIFPLTFIANTFVPSENMPAVLRTIAGWNPVSTLTHAARDLFGNLFALTPGGAAQGEATRASIEYTWALQHAALYTLGWAAVLMLVFVPLSIRAYQRSVAR